MAPLSVKLPLPSLVMPPVPLAAPLKVVLVASPVLRVLAPRVRLPAPAREPMVSAVSRFRVAPLATVTAPVLAIALPPDRLSVPALMLVRPV